MRKMLTILIGLLCSAQVYAQPEYFNNRYDTDFYENAWSVVALDTGYVIGGVNGGVGLIWDLVILKLDEQGDTVWYKEYDDSTNRYYPGGPGSLIQTNEGGFALAGSDNDNAMLWKFDQNGDSLWTKKYANSSWQVAIQCKQTLDNGYIIIGRSKVADPDGDFWLIKTDSLGDIEWDNTYGGGGYEYGVSVDICSDGGYILAGATDSYGPGIPMFSNFYIVKTDSMGVEEWNRVIGGPFGECVWNVQHTSDGGYIVGGCYEDDDLTNLSRPYLIKLDSAGNTEWDKKYGPPRWSTTLFMVRELTDGSFIAAGQIQDTLGMTGLILKVASNGDSLWYRFYQNLLSTDSDNKFRDIRPTSDGGFIAAGWVSPGPPDTGTQDMWVIKLDSMGCVVENCFVGIENRTEAKIEMNVYPNPFTYEAIVQFDNLTDNAELTIYDATGRLIKKYSIPQYQNNITLVASEIGSGIFFLQLTGNHSVIASQKVIISD